MELNRVALRAERKRFEFERGKKSAHADGLADHLNISGCEHLHHALIKAEVAHGVFDLSILHEPHTIARESGEQLGAWINHADVPKAR